VKPLDIFDSGAWFEPDDQFVGNRFRCWSRADQLRGVLHPGAKDEQFGARIGIGEHSEIEITEQQTKRFILREILELGGDYVIRIGFEIHAPAGSSGDLTEDLAQITRFYICADAVLVGLPSERLRGER